MRIDPSLQAALRSIPRGRWAVGVSGGADSMALFHLLLRRRRRFRLVVAHLNHQTRGPQSDADEAFVCDEVRRNLVSCRTAQRDAIERESTDLPANPSARFRAARFELFRRVVTANRLDGVILAHHADDQAETVFLRLLRGASYPSLAGIADRATLQGVRVLRPLLNVRRAILRSFLRDQNLSWREDPSNRSPKYLRNRLRAILTDRPDLTDALLELSRACASLKQFARRAAPVLGNSFAVGLLDDLPAILARESAGRWLRERGVPPGLIDRASIERLRTMCADAGSANRQQFPGGISVRRRAGIISAE